ncbi:MAG TPA: electron transport complex subunit RsxG [Gammaproteobacteria bacterium]|nr:electron transport complex subunit RsxG [Gammaproteobacteria bacterium]
MRYRTILFTGILLSLFTVIGATLVAYTFENTKARIAANERAALLRNLHVLVPPDSHTNDLFRDVIEVQDPTLLGSRDPVQVYRARRNGEPVALVLTPEAPDGYSGAIRLLVGIDPEGTLIGVRVLSHRETPGLGDAIEAERSDWILDFDGRSLGNPPAAQWRVRRDGGVFDQFTGATVTPRAVVNAVRKSLIYFDRHREDLFAPVTGLE